MFGFLSNKRRKQELNELATKIQAKINETYLRIPNNEMFEQAGLLNGSEIVKEYTDEGEFELAVAHMLYMIYETDILFPTEILSELNAFISTYKVENVYL